MNHAETRRKQLQIIAHVLSLVALLVFESKIGCNGIAYLAVALFSFWMIWMPTGGFLAEVSGKLLRSRNSKGQYKNADKVKKTVAVLHPFLGVIGAVLLFVLSGVFAENVFRMPYSKFMIVILAPVILVKMFSEMLCGFFQGEGNELPVVIASVLRPLAIIFGGLFFCNHFAQYGEKVSNLLGQEAFLAMYGGIGISLAVLIAEAVVVIFLYVAYKGIWRLGRKKDTEGMRMTDSFGNLTRIICNSRAISFLQAVLEGLPLWLGLIFYQKKVELTLASASHYGIYIGKYAVVCGVVICLIVTWLLPFIAKTCASIRKDEFRHGANIFGCGIKIGMLTSCFFAVFIAVMAEQMAAVFAQNDKQMLADMLSNGSCVIVLVPLAFYFSRILIRLGRKVWAFGCVCIADIGFAVALSLGLQSQNISVIVLVNATVLWSIVYAVLGGFGVCLLLRTVPDWIRGVVIPVGCAALSGLFCYLLEKVMTPHLGALVTLIVLGVLSFMVYCAVVLFTRCITRQDMNIMSDSPLAYLFGRFFRLHQK